MLFNNKIRYWLGLPAIARCNGYWVITRRDLFRRECWDRRGYWWPPHDCDVTRYAARAEAIAALLAMKPYVPMYLHEEGQE